MKKRYLVLAIGLLFITISFPYQAFARDPGIPDTVRFGECPYDLSGPPYEGAMVVSLLVFNDEYLYGIDIPLNWSGPMVCDSGKFVGERPQHFTHYAGISIQNTYKEVYVYGAALEDSIPTGQGVLAYLYFSLTDTGFISIDSTILPIGEGYLHFVDNTVAVVNPQMVELECRLVPGVPGDMTGDEQVDIGDVVFLINYLYKHGPPPEVPELGDVNGDGTIDLSDVIYLINYLFRNGPLPEKSCPSN